MKTDKSRADRVKMILGAVSSAIPFSAFWVSTQSGRAVYIYMGVVAAWAIGVTAFYVVVARRERNRQG